jgi:hypothetical protein
MASWGGAWRLQAIITGIVCASAVALSAPASSNSDAAGKPDPAPSHEAARGGASARGIAFVLAPDWGLVHRNAFRRIRDDVRAALRTEGIRHDDVRISGSALRFRVPDRSAVGSAHAAVARVARALNLTPSEQMPGLAVRAAPDGAFSVQLTGFGLASLHDGFVAASMQELQRRLMGSRFDHYLLTDDGGRIRLEFPPLAGPAHAGRQC